MEHITCEVIEDLLPLYCDGICSADSRGIVEAHLQTCPKCSELLKKMQTECSISDEAEDKHEELVRDMASTWRDSVKKSFCRGVLITLFTCLILAGGYWALSRRIMVTVPLSRLEATVESVTNETVVIYLEVTDGKKVSFVSGKITEDGIYYITLKRGVIAETNGGGENWTMDCSISRLGTADSGTKVPIKVIYCGTESNRILIWQAE